MNGQLDSKSIDEKKRDTNYRKVIDCILQHKKEINVNITRWKVNHQISLTTAACFLWLVCFFQKHEQKAGDKFIQ